MKPIKTLVCLLLALLTLSLPALNVFAADDYYMAYNFYSDPVLSDTSGAFDSFMIDFRGVKTPMSTYWALINFGLYLGSSNTQKQYPGISGGGAYGGLQHTVNGRKGILSFWETKYYTDGEPVVMTSTRMYPDGSSTFTGEGDGTNIIADYPWEDNKWYRMLVHSWTDEETGTTFVGEWFLDVESGTWTLFSYFDTHLYDSYLIGGLSQFQENYSKYTYNYAYERECNLKNIYAYDHFRKSWKSLDQSRLSYGDGGGKNKAGAHSFGKSSDEDGEFYWGATGGRVEDQEAYEAAATTSEVFTLDDQPSVPDLTASGVDSVAMIQGEDGPEVQWTVSDTASPQFGFVVKVYDVYDRLLYTKRLTRPEQRSLSIAEVEETAVRCEVECLSVFDASTGASGAQSEAYDDAPVLRAGNATVVNHSTVEVPLYLDAAGSYDGFDFDVHFDTDALEFVSGTILPQGQSGVSCSGSAVRLSLENADVQPGDPIALLTFRAKKMGVTQLKPKAYPQRSLFTKNGEEKTFLPTRTAPGTVAVTFDDVNDFGFLLDVDPITVDSTKIYANVVMTNPPADIYGFSIEVLYDPDLLSFDEGDFSKAFPFGKLLNPEPGRVRIFAATPVNAPVNTETVIAQLSFNIIDAGKAQGSTYDLSVYFYNPRQPAYTLDENKHTVNISDVYADSVTLTVEARDRYDLNTDGIRSISDVTTLLNAIAFKQGSFDLDGDRETTISDVTTLLNVLAGLL